MCGQFVGQGDRHTQSHLSARRFAKTWNAASLPMALSERGVTTEGMTTSSPIPAKASAYAARNTRRMAETAVHLTDHVFPRLSASNGCWTPRTPASGNSSETSFSSNIPSATHPEKCTCSYRAGAEVVHAHDFDDVQRYSVYMCRIVVVSLQFSEISRKSCAVPCLASPPSGCVKDAYEPCQ